MKTIITVIISVAIVVGVVFAYQIYSTPPSLAELQPSDALSSSETSHWKTYKDDTFGFQIRYPANFVFKSPYQSDTVTPPEQLSWSLTTTPTSQPHDCYISAMGWSIFDANSENGKATRALYEDPEAKRISPGGKEMAIKSETGICGGYQVAYFDSTQSKVLNFSYSLGPENVHREVFTILGSFGFFTPTSDLKFSVRGLCEAKFGVQNNPAVAASYRQACATAISQSLCEQVDVYNHIDQAMETPDGIPDCQWITRYDYPQ